MSSSRLDAKGRVALPKAVIDALSLSEGDEIEFVQLESQRFQLFARNRSVTELKGLFEPSRHVTIDEMVDIVAASGARAKGTGN